MAGFGVEPAMVFDFGQMLNVPMERARLGTGKTVTFGGDSAGTTGFACGAAVTCRDSIAGPDELAFQYRNPYFNHRILSVGSETSIRIAGPAPPAHPGRPGLPGGLLHREHGLGLRPGRRARWPPPRTP